MKHLYDIFENGIVGTPANTMGAGNPALPSNTTSPNQLSAQPGSGDLLSKKKRKRK